MKKISAYMYAYLCVHKKILQLCLNINAFPSVSGQVFKECMCVCTYLSIIENGKHFKQNTECFNHSTKQFFLKTKRYSLITIFVSRQIEKNELLEILLEIRKWFRHISFYSISEHFAN